MTRIGNWKSENGKVTSEKRNSKYEIRFSLPGIGLLGGLRWLGHGFLACRLAMLCTLFAFSVSVFLLSADGLPAQDLDKPSVNIDEDVTAFAFAPELRRRLLRLKSLQTETCATDTFPHLSFIY